MNLIIDAGNTKVKLAVFKGDKIVFVVKVLFEDVIEKIKNIFLEYSNINKVISSSVSKLNKEHLKQLFKNVNWVVLDYKTKIPFQNLYKTPETLGVDRIALVANAVNKHSEKNVLVIDAGTCITYDFVNKKSEYYGGSIAPGLHLRYKSLSDYTENLPLLSPKYPNTLIGNSTENAIHAGVSNGVIAEINGVINEFSNNYKHLVVILTGGDAIFLSERLKSGIFVDPEFLLYGLNYILEYTTSK